MHSMARDRDDIRCHICDRAGHFKSVTYASSISNRMMDCNHGNVKNRATHADSINEEVDAGGSYVVLIL